MKKVAVRDFQLHASKLLKELPLELTVYGKPVAVVSSLNLSTVVQIEPVPEKKELTETELEPQQAPQIPIGGSIPEPVLPYKPKSSNFISSRKTWTKEKLDKFASLETPTSPRCQVPNCLKESIGQFEFYVYNDGSEVKLTKSLCSFHKTKVEREQPI